MMDYVRSHAYRHGRLGMKKAKLPAEMPLATDITTGIFFQALFGAHGQKPT